jgi:putative transcriptional regulator
MALREALAGLGPLRWRLLLPGLRAIDLPLPPATARLLRFRPGLTIPLHDHAGLELTVVLSGSIADEAGAATAGDVVVRAPGQHHAQLVGAEEACVALVVNEGPLIPRNRWGRLLKRLAGV